MTTIEPFFIRQDTVSVRQLLPLSTFLVSVPLGFLVGIVGVALGTRSASIGQLLLVAAVGVPAISVFESFRLAHIRAGRPSLASRINFFWLLGSASGIALLPATPSGLELLAVWIGPPIAVGSLALARNGKQPAGRVLQLAAEGRRTGLGFGADYLIGVGTVQVTGILLVSILSVADVGSFRLVLSWFGPLGILFSGLAPVLLAHRLDKPEGKNSDTGLLAFGFALAISAAGFTIVSILAPSLLSAAVGDTAADRLRDLILPTGAATSSVGFGAGAALGLRQDGRASEMAAIRALLAPLAIAAPLVGAVYWGLAGASWGIAIHATALTLCLWLLLKRIGPSM